MFVSAPTNPSSLPPPLPPRRRNDGRESGEYAPVMFRTARWFPIASGTFWLSGTPYTPGSKGWDAKLPRIATWARLVDLHAPERPPVLFLSTHLEYEGLEARARGAEVLASAIASAPSVILTGDFNCGVGSPAYTTLCEGRPPRLVDAYRACHRASSDEGTFTGFGPTAITSERIDWIAVTPDWAPKTASIVTTTTDGRTPSDHFPVVAHLSRRA